MCGCTRMSLYFLEPLDLPLKAYNIWTVLSYHGRRRLRINWRSKSQQTRLLRLALSFPALEWAISLNEFISYMSLELLLNFGPLSCNYSEQQCCWEREVKLGLICAALAPLGPSWTASYSLHCIGKSSWKVVGEVFLFMTGPDCNVISWPQKFMYVKPSLQV